MSLMSDAVALPNIAQWDCATVCVWSPDSQDQRWLNSSGMDWKQGKGI